MRKIPCLNLDMCRMKNAAKKEQDLDLTILEYTKESGYTSFQRVYVGSSFCAQYFLSISNDRMWQIRRFCEQLQIKLTLVVPTATQKNLILVKEKLQELIAIGNSCVDEITINDYGMLHYTKENYDRNLNLGRLFMKDYRDKRYQDYFHQRLQPKIMNPTMKEFLMNYGVTGLEFDLTHNEIDFSDVPKEFMIGVHYPYCYQTVGHICEAASIHVPVEQKFRPSHPCHQECEKMILMYQTEMGVDYYKQGRVVFFENTDCNIMNREEIRLIYTPKLNGGEY